MLLIAKAQDASITRSAPVSQEKKIEKPIQNMWANTPPPDVPDWLKGTVEPQVLSAQAEETQIVPNVETKVEAESVPDWLKGGAEPQVSFAQPEETQRTPSVETKTEAEVVPDWLRGSLVSDATPKITSPENMAPVETKIEDTEVPDWLQWSIGKETVSGEKIEEEILPRVETKIERECG